MVGINDKEDFNSRTDCPDTFAVRRLFVFLKENLNFDYLQDEFIQRNIISQRELADYILTVHEYLRSEQLLKLIIKRKRCQEFVVCMQDFPEFEHINQIIRKFKNKRGLKGSAEKMSKEMLNKHFELLYTVLEPRDIANEMLQAGYMHPHYHDEITKNRQKYKRLEILLEVLECKKLYTSFVRILEYLQYTSLLETLNTGAPYINILSEEAVCIQQNFTTLQNELPGSDHATEMMEHVLSKSNVLDIKSCSGAYREKAKLLKTLILNGQFACQQLFEAIKSNLKREDLIQKMKNHIEDISNRGRPVLESNLRCLTTACLLNHEDFLFEELEPIFLCDFLFEEGAIGILSHDIITETSQRRKQVKFLIKTIMENKHDCFHFFLYILKREDYGYVCQTLADYSSSISDGVQIEPIQLRLAVQYDDGTEMCQTLYQNINFFDTNALRDMIYQGHITMERATSISVEVQIRHISDELDEPDPVHFDDKEYKKSIKKRL